MLDLHQILDEEGQKGVAVFRAALSPHNATRKTSESAYYKIEGSKERTVISILARPFTEVLQTGSKPAKSIKPPKEMIEEMKLWARARGIPEDAVYGIAVNILKEGQNVSRDVWTSKMNEWADQVADRITEELAGYAVDQMVKSFTK